MTDRVVVIGSGSAEARPDLMVAAMEAESTASDVASALAGAQGAVAAMAVAARARGMADGDVRTSDVTVSTNYGKDGPEGFRAAIGLAMTLRDLDAAGAVLADVVAAGGDASRVRQVSLTVAEPGEALDAAREAAFADARHQAEQLAGLAGRTLGPVQRVEPRQSFVPFARAASIGGPQAGEKSLTVPVEPGSTALTVTLQVRFALT